MFRAPKTFRRIADAVMLATDPELDVCGSFTRCHTRHLPTDWEDIEINRSRSWKMYRRFQHRDHKSSEKMRAFCYNRLLI